MTDGHAQALHLGICPRHILIGPNGEVTLDHAQAASATDSASNLSGGLHTLAYASRELLDGRPDHRSDLYAVGAVLYELLDGRRFRWHCADEDAMVHEIHRDRVPTLSRDDVPAPLLGVLRALLEPELARRMSSAEAALQRLDRWPGFMWAPAKLQALYQQAMAPSERPGHSATVTERDAPRTRSWATSQAATQLAVAAASAPIPEQQAATQPLPAAEPTLILEDPSERLVTRIQPMARDLHDVPTARRAAERAVTQPQPSRQAPWAADTDPFHQASPEREPSAPRLRRRPARDSRSNGAEARANTVPKPRNSAALHRAAGYRARGATGEVIAGEIVADEVRGVPVWRVGSR